MSAQAGKRVLIFFTTRPYTTDPNSPRVCEMIKKSYHKIPLVGNNQHFGRMTTYIRMDDPSYPAAVQKEDFGLKT